MLSVALNVLSLVLVLPSVALGLMFATVESAARDGPAPLLGALWRLLGWLPDPGLLLILALLALLLAAVAAARFRWILPVLISAAGVATLAGPLRAPDASGSFVDAISLADVLGIAISLAQLGGYIVRRRAAG